MEYIKCLPAHSHVVTFTNPQNEMFVDNLHRRDVLPGTSDPPLRTDSLAPYLGNGHCSFWAYPQGPTLQPVREGGGC